MTGPSPLRRRRLSRGLIAAGGANRSSGGSGGGGDGAPRQGDENNLNTPAGTAAGGGSGSGSSIKNPLSRSASSGSGNNSGSVDPSVDNNNTPNSNTNALPVLPKPCYSGRLALACVQNALQMGVMTKFSLCPQGKARNNLVVKTKAAREQRKRQSKKQGGSGDSGDGNDRAEELFLQNPPYRGSAGTTTEEEYSSGDDDDFDGSIMEDDDDAIPHLGALHHSHSNTLDSRKEPYFIPTAADAASMGLQGGQVPGMTAGRLPFNYRKVRYFDSVTASDRAVARQFLQGELNNAKKLRSRALSNHLKKVRVRERERMERESEGGDSQNKPRSENVEEGGSDTVDLKEEQTALATALSRFPHELTPTLSAALLIESLAMNHHESIEGMAKCYDGIVSAGTALLDLANNNNIMRGSNDGGNSPHAHGAGKQKKLTTSEIMGALAPLLITTIEQSSGEAIVALAKLRNFCGTKRYQRRFVQRIAPFLLRPPNAAMWCLRHQSDIEPIIAAVEMILDNATEVFSQGWFERGRVMLKDTQRAETLRTAASKLRRLNSPSSTNDGLGLLVGLSTPAGSTRRLSVGCMGESKKDGISIITNDSLAEWEVVAIDKGIRQSILDVFSRDWSRISTLNLSPKESESTTPFGSRQRRGISTAKSKEWQDATTVSAGICGGGSTSSSQVSGLMPALSITKSQRSLSKLPLSPRSSTNLSTLPSADALETAFGPSFSSQNVVIDDNGRPTSPTDYSVLSTSTPLSPQRDSSSSLITPKTPPTHHMHEVRHDDRITMPNFQDQQPPQHSSPARGAGMTAPLSPQSSVGNASTSSLGTLRSFASTTNTSQMASSSTRDQNRALTSTASERKRTVAACRALRAQITQFEDAFIQMHGRAPKGAAERAPLASTYMQYREWKRAIRADAACRIQALCRGARMRLMLTRSEDQRICNFVLERAMKSTTSKPLPLNHLSIPLDMGGDDADSALTRTRLETRTGQRGDDSVEVEMVPSLSPPNWRNRQQQSPQQRTQQQQQQQTGGSSPGTSNSHKSSSSRSRISLPDVSVMSLIELHQRKRELKQQLKMYDMNFHAQHSRMPEKREKEPIRHLYESYNAYKNQITVIEKGEAQPGPGTAAFRGGVSITDVSATTAEDVSPKEVSPTYNSGDTSPSQGHFKRLSSGGGSESIEASGSQEEMNTSTSEVSSQDLTSLKAEKATLHQTLRSYEKDFFKQQKRQVSSFADIRPVASQYRRYKEIKKAIAQKSSS